MAQISANFKSEALGFHSHIEVIFPFHDPAAAKVLYLLHGLSDNCTSWTRMTRIYHYAMSNNFIVVMPEVQRSFYADMVHGSKYFTYVTEELPQICEKIFNIHHTRDKTFVAGLSMGGYGAAKCALAKPEFYAACASFSGAMDMKARVEAAKTSSNPLVFSEIKAILGEDMIYPDNTDLFYLATEAAKLATKPKMLVTCGDDDFLLDDNRRFDAHMQALNYGHTYKEWPGQHTWDFWEECLPLAFEFFK